MREIVVAGSVFVCLAVASIGTMMIYPRLPARHREEETTTVDRFERYDDKINVDGFSLLHEEFFDHKVLLPGVQLQKGNPARQTHTGDGVNYAVDYIYTYDDLNRPLTKAGALTFSNGPDAGKTFATRSIFSYYD